MLDEAQIPLFTAECIIGETPQLIRNPTLLTRSNSSLFYKEQLFNMLEKKVPSKYTKLIFMDSDIIFSIPNWVDEISKKLKSYCAVQPFSKGLYLDASETVFFECVSYTKKIESAGRPFEGHPGFCWALNRKFLNEMGGFFDKAVIGSGDSAIASVFNRFSYNFKSSFIHTEYLQWRLKARLAIRSLTYLDIDVYHLYHGDIANRQYATRHTLPELLKIKTWEDAVSVNEYGMYEIKNPEINEVLKNYFLSRKEDD
jgi:hypothetical protein